MGMETLPLLIGGAGALTSGIGNIVQGRRQERRQRRVSDRAFDVFDQTQGPGFLEGILRSQFNVGQDGQMQMLRSAPGAQTFDTSELFDALQPIRRRQLQEGLGEVRSSAPGLGQRFGSSMNRNLANLTREHLQNIAAQDASTQFQAFESGQARQMGLMQLLSQLEQGRRGAGLGALQTAAGIPMAQPQNFGQPLTDIGQLLLLRQLMGD